MRIQEPRWAIEARSAGDRLPLETSERFVAFMECSSEMCGEVIVLAGTTDWNESREATHEYDRVLMPQFVHPAPPLIHVPERCPGAVHDQLAVSFSLYWSNVEAAANSLRSVLECILDLEKVRRFAMAAAKNGKSRHRVRVSLHSRIQLWSAKRPGLARRMLAIKWIGNQGSHSRPLTHEDLLDGFALLEDILSNLYPDKTLARIEREINARKKPRSSVARKAK